MQGFPLRPGQPDEYDIPFRIPRGYFYQVRGPLRHGAGTPVIFDLRDFNGDGKDLEFCLSVMHSRTGPSTMVLGYSQRQDRVIIYSFHLRGELWGENNPVTNWMDRFSFQKPLSPMHWHYDLWYNSGVDVEFDLRDIPERESFEGTVRSKDSWTAQNRKP